VRALVRPGIAVWLTAVWVGLWGSISVANLLGGLAVALALLTLLPLPEVPARGVVRPWGVARFLGYFAFDLVRASLQVIGLVLRPRKQLRQGVVAVEVVGASDQLLTLLGNAISLTPGTLTLEVDRERRILYVHLLQLDADPGAVHRVRRDILRLERLAIGAIGSPQARTTLVPPTSGAAS
jgi:multicomponent Na+:H+ antiporter subunit E